MALTPMMQQYFEIKEKYKDCILFFRLGDFYEMFFEDAETASKELELVLTGRDCGLENRAPMCGIPYHAATSYIGRLISKGYKVAIGEQVEDPALAKGIVRRDVIKVITPGTFTDTSFIDDSKNNFIMSIYKSKENLCSISSSDISTGDFYCTSFTYDISLIGDEISKFKPSEIILNEDFKDHKQEFDLIYNGLISFKDNIYFENDYSYLYNQFKNLELDLIQDEKKSSINALIKYIIDTQKMSLSNINKIDFYSIEDFMTIDASSRKNLELTENIRDKNKKDSLLWVLDKTKTSMGSRALRRWIEEPLVSLEKIEGRLEAVEELYNSLINLEELRDALNSIYDIERIIGKISNKNVSAKDLISLKLSLFKVPVIKELLAKFNSSLLKKYYEDLDESY